MRWRQGVAFTVLCLWTSAGWWSGGWLPDGVSPAFGYGLGYLLLGAGAFVLALWRSVVPTAGLTWRLGVAGVGVLGLPFLLVSGAAGRAAAGVGVLGFAMLGIVLIPVGAALGDGGPGMGVLPFGLAGAAGVMLLLPVHLPSGPQEWVGLALVTLAVGVTACGLVLLRRWLPAASVPGAFAVVCGANGVLLTAAGLFGGGWAGMRVGISFIALVRCMVLDLPETFLLLWLLRGVAAHRLAARYLVAPLVTVAVGYAVMRPGLDARTVAGVGLLGWGAFRLWGFEGGDDGAPLRLSDAGATLPDSRSLRE